MKCRGESSRCRLHAQLKEGRQPLLGGRLGMNTNDALIIRNATIDDAPAIGSMVDEFRSYLQALGDVYACVNFGSEPYRRDGFGPNPAFQGLIAERDGQALAYALYAFDYSQILAAEPYF